MNNLCPHCGEKFFLQERNAKNIFTKCCFEGKVALPPILPPSHGIVNLYNGESAHLRHFHDDLPVQLNNGNGFVECNIERASCVGTTCHGNTWPGVSFNECCSCPSTRSTARICSAIHVGHSAGSKRKI